MKVLYFIAARGSGVGGHSWSLGTLCTAMKESVDCGIVDLGENASPALKDIDVPYWHVPWSDSRFFWNLSRITRLVRSEAPDVLHSYDGRAFLAARMVAWRCRAGLVHTKCGGANPASYFPKISHLVLFSTENYEYFTADRRFRDSRIHLIPNRVGVVGHDPEGVARIRGDVPPGSLVLLRVARLAPEYDEASLQALSLVRRLREDGVRISFVQVGAVQSEASLEAVRSALGPDDRLYSDPVMTARGGRLLAAGDLIMGTGRGLMEAATTGRLLLCPLAGSTYPVLLSPDNFPALFRTNFSPRGRLAGHDDESGYRAVLSALAPDGARQDLIDFYQKVFADHFSVTGAVPAHLALYGGLGPAPRPAFDFARQALHVLLG
jgi:hypothetical protein